MNVSRLRLLDIQNSRLPESIGLCATDTAQFASLVNAAQERLLTCREAGDTGWWGGYAEMVFNVTQANPYITMPRGVARLIKIDACNTPIRIRNQFYEYLQFGDGRWPKVDCSNNECTAGPAESFRRNVVPTMTDLTVPGYTLRFYVSSVSDAGKRVLVGATDSNDQTIFTIDNSVQVNGCFATLASPFVDLILPGAVTAVELASITGIMKDPTVAPVSVYEVNLSTLATNLLLQMEPGETIAGYSRYYLNSLPDGCCPTPGVTGTVQCTAMVKLDLIPVVVSTDYLLIQSAEAIIAECQSIRLGDMDSSDAKMQSASRHRDAIRYLQGQLVHYEGTQDAAVSFRPFGMSRLSKQRIGQMQ